MIGQFDLVTDVINIIHHLPSWCERVFKLPNLDDFDNMKTSWATYKNNDDNVFRKINLANVGVSYVHNHQNKEVLLAINNRKIDKVEFFYDHDLDHYYKIDYKDSTIRKIAIIKQHFELVKLDGQVYAVVVDPTFIVI